MSNKPVWNTSGSSISYLEYLRRQPHLWSNHLKKKTKQCIHFSLCETRYPNSSDRDISVAVAMKDSIAMKNPPAPHFKQEIIYCVHLEKQLSIDIKTWRCGEEKYYTLNYLWAQGLAAMLLSGRNVKLWV